MTFTPSQKIGTIHEWVMSLDLPEKVATEVEDMLTKLGGRKTSDLAELEEDDVQNLIVFVPKLQRNNFKKQLAIYRKVKSLSL